MNSPSQLFGHSDTASGRINIMCCRDIDTPNEILLHLWGGAFEKPRALRCNLAQADTKGLRAIQIRNYYTVNSNGGLYLPVLSDDEVAALHALRIDLKVNDTKIVGTWTSQNENGSLELLPWTGGTEVKAIPLETWAEFKQWAGETRAKDGTVLFRGHGSSLFALKTTFHRTGRQNLVKYCDTVMPEFRSHAEAALRIRLDGDSNDFATVLALAQHHGLPTPLLDFTASPYIAAFFAFADALDQERRDATHVRIFALTANFIETNSSSIIAINAAKPYIQRLAVSPINNPRLYAQQGQFLVTNLSDVERFITEHEERTQVRALYAVDIPISQTVTALEDLKYMGVTAATMFPGLDGACKMMKHDMMFRAQSLGTVLPSQGL